MTKLGSTAKAVHHYWWFKLQNSLSETQSVTQLQLKSFKDRTEPTLKGEESPKQNQPPRSSQNVKLTIKEVPYFVQIDLKVGNLIKES